MAAPAPIPAMIAAPAPNITVQVNSTNNNDLHNTNTNTNTNSNQVGPANGEKKKLPPIRPWKFGLFGCMSDPMLLLQTLCCPWNAAIYVGVCGDANTDFCFHVCVPCCALIQEKKEVVEAMRVADDGGEQ
ncbi:hypothetical protein HK101_002196 [Irineochytrium annulatum]|nr:hypothetical protein HK101_002196 [Irineochytrium annulatum]